MIFMLVVVVVAAVLVVSSSVSLERSKKYVTEQQAYYAVASAIQTAQTMVEGDTSIGSLTLYRASSTESLAPKETITDTTGLANWAEDQVNNIIAGNSSNSKTIYISVTSEEETIPEVPEVKLTFSMSSASTDKYAITIVASESSDDPDYAYSLTSTVNASVEESGDTLTIYWHDNSGGTN
jgi:type II secretory pathway pseudopilin PulG